MVLIFFFSNVIIIFIHNFIHLKKFVLTGLDYGSDKTHVLKFFENKSENPRLFFNLSSLFFFFCILNSNKKLKVFSYHTNCSSKILRGINWSTNIKTINKKRG